MPKLILTVCLVGRSKEYSPVLANPKVVTKVDEPVVDVVLSVSRRIPCTAFTCILLMLGLDYGLPWGFRGCCFPVGQSLRPRPVSFPRS